MKEIYIYISGKIGNGQMPTKAQMDEAREKFEAAEKVLRDAGFIPINPLKLGIPPKLSYRDTLDICLGVLERKAHGILMLKDYKESSGAKEEFKAAILRELIIYKEADGDMHRLADYAAFCWGIEPAEELV